MATSPKLPLPSPDQLKAAHQAADDAGTVAHAFPPPEAWQAEFPDLYTETPDGKWHVPYRNQGLTTLECEKNSARVQAMLRNWQATCGETSGRRDALVETVRVRGRDGVVMHLPAQQEQRLAEKGFVSAVRHIGRARVSYWWDSHGRRWKKERHGDWQLD